MLVNNDTTPFEVVMIVLVHVFGMSTPRAFEIMMQAHGTGRATALVSTREVVESKCAEGNRLAEGLWPDGEAVFVPERES